MMTDTMKKIFALMERYSSKLMMKFYLMKPQIPGVLPLPCFTLCVVPRKIIFQEIFTDS